MSENNLYYIYIDTKIKGTIDQLVGYFQTKVFNEKDCIFVYCKFYKEIARYIERKFSKHNIPLKFIKKNSDLTFISGKVVFYLFNAQSNCKLVAHRELIHVFVTHGESNKLASIKPIIKIYDYIVSSGQIGVDRYLKSSIFSESDISNQKKVILMGNTFIGQNNFFYSPSSKNLLYAPTWEGGIPEENYSSIGDLALNNLIEISVNNNIKNIYIQAHPNLGHRDKKYLVLFKKLVLGLKKYGFNVFLLQDKISIYDRLNFIGVKFKHIQKNLLSLQCAVVDISAMEIQLIYNNIPTAVFYDERLLNKLVIPSNIEYLYCSSFALNNFNFRKFDFERRQISINEKFSYLISYTDKKLEKMDFRERIKWLCSYVFENKNKLVSKNLSRY